MLRALRRVFSGLRFVLAVVLLTWSTLSPSSVFAQTKKFQWSGRVGLSEQYDSNINLSPDNEEDDWITRVGPGLTLAVLFEKTEVRLDYDFQYNFYAKNDDNNNASHFLTLSGLNNVPLSDHVTFDLDASVTRSEDPLGISDQVTSVRRTREPYWRYIAGGRVNYNFGEEDRVYAGFNYNQLENDDPTVQDSRGYGPTAGIAYWFNIRNGLSADLEYRQAEFDVSSDFDAYRGSATYTHRFSSRTQADLTYGYDRLDYDEETVEARVGVEGGTLVFDRDFEIHSISLGVSHQFTPHISGSISGGYFIRKPKTGDDTSDPLGSASLSLTSERSSFVLEAEGGYRYQTLQAENLGFSLYGRGSATFTYQLLEKLTTSLGGFYWYDKYQDTFPERKDQTWGGNAALNYLFLDWLRGSLSYEYRQRDSNIDENEYIDNRVTLRLVAFYLSEPKPF